MKWMRPWIALAPFLLGAAPAGAALDIDPSLSTLVPTVGAIESLSGTLVALPGAPPPLAATTTFDVLALSAASSGGLDIRLDPSLSSPAAGVLNTAGGFLIPNLFLELDDGLVTFQLTVPNVTGSYGDFPGCPTALCLETTFAVDTAGPAGVVTVHLLAIPEPGSAALVSLGLVALARGVRREGSR